MQKVRGESRSQTPFPSHRVYVYCRVEPGERGMSPESVVKDSLIPRPLSSEFPCDFFTLKSETETQRFSFINPTSLPKVNPLHSDVT